MINCGTSSLSRQSQVRGHTGGEYDQRDLGVETSGEIGQAQWVALGQMQLWRDEAEAGRVHQ